MTDSSELHGVNEAEQPTAAEPASVSNEAATPPVPNPPESESQATSASSPTPTSTVSPTPASGAEVVGEATVISQRPPLTAALPRDGLGPRELGQTLVGRKLAHFHLMDFVGGGGMGAVFRATDTMLNRTVAVKVLSRDQGQDEETVRRFQNEAQSAARLDHENIARVYYVGEDDGWYFIVFEFIEGRNLRELVMERGPLPVEQALQVTLQVAEALQHAAKREVVHRDIKPSNVLLTPDGKAKLVDMGLARLRPMNTHDGDLTASGVTLGTFDYISPEQARDPRQADVRSDLYSLGCTLYFMLTGQPPFPEGTVLQKLLSHNSEAPPDPRQLRDDLPPELMPIMHRMLAKKPSERYQRPVGLIADLLILADRLGMATPTRTEAVWVAPPPSRWQRLQLHLPWMVPSVLLLLLSLLWDPAWLDGGVRAEPQPKFNVPKQAVAPPAAYSDSRAIPNDKTMASRDGHRTSPATSSATSGGATDLQDNSPQTTPAGNTSPNTPAVHRDTTASQATDDDAEPAPTNSPAAVAAASPIRDNTTASEPTTPRTARTNDPNSKVPAQTLIVDDSPSLLPAEGELVVSNLDEACRVAMQNTAIDTIEIRKSGRIEVPGLKLRLANRSLTLVAGTGYAPILVFRAGGIGDTAPNSQGIVRVEGGELNLRGLHLELTLANQAFEGDWSLFELENVRTFGLQQSTLTIENSNGGRFSNLANVSVFNCVAPPRDDMLDPDMGVPRSVTSIELNDCIVRCEATVVVAKEAIPLTIKWHNGLLVTSERLLRLGGSAKSAVESEQVTIDLHHVTAIVDQGLLETSATLMRPNLIPVSITSQNCIFVTQRWSALIAQSGPRNLSELMAQINYRAENTGYEDMEALWKIAPQDGGPTETFDFEMWQSQWGETQPIWQQVRWRYAL